MSKKTPEPDPEFDKALSEAINDHQTEETVRENARLVGAYYTTLTACGVPDEHAADMTCHWVAIMASE